VRAHNAQRLGVGGDAGVAEQGSQALEGAIFEVR